MIGSICVKCKGGRNLCGLGYCPLIKKASDLFPRLSLSSKEYDGYAPPSLFVGRYGYPKVYAGPMISKKIDIFEPEKWYGMKLEDIAIRSSSLLRPSVLVDVHTSDRIIETTQEIAMSSRPVPAEIILNRPVYTAKGELDFLIHPMGPLLEMKKLYITSNPHVPLKVEQVVSDTDIPAVYGGMILYKSNISISHIQRILSAGLLGYKNKKKLVPTRWSITAVDDMIGKEIINEIKNYSTIDTVKFFYNSYLGNSFYIYLIPAIWRFEMIEAWEKGSVYVSSDIFTGDFEDYTGRTTYAENVTGGYYAARLAVLEYLARIRRQASVIIYREVSEEYAIPLGVWLVRESVRRAMEGKSTDYDEIENAIAGTSINMKFKMWHTTSRLLKNYKEQSSLDKFFR